MTSVNPRQSQAILDIYVRLYELKGFEIGLLGDVPEQLLRHLEVERLIDGMVDLARTVLPCSAHLTVVALDAVAVLAVVEAPCRNGSALLVEDMPLRAREVACGRAREALVAPVAEESVAAVPLAT